MPNRAMSLKQSSEVNCVRNIRAGNFKVDEKGKSDDSNDYKFTILHKVQTAV